MVELEDQEKKLDDLEEQIEFCGDGNGNIQAILDELNCGDDDFDGIPNAFEDFNGRAIFVYGGADPEAAGARQVYEPFAAQHGIDAQFHSIDGANHSFYSKEWKQQVIELCLGWLDAGAKE